MSSFPNNIDMKTTRFHTEHRVGSKGKQSKGLKNKVHI